MKTKERKLLEKQYQQAKDMKAQAMLIYNTAAQLENEAAIALGMLGNKTGATRKGMNEELRAKLINNLTSWTIKEEKN